MWHVTKDSLTISQIPWLFQVYKIPWQFQVCGNPVKMSRISQHSYIMTTNLSRDKQLSHSRETARRLLNFKLQTGRKLCLLVSTARVEGYMCFDAWPYAVMYLPFVPVDVKCYCFACCRVCALLLFYVLYYHNCWRTNTVQVNNSLKYTVWGLASLHDLSHKTVAKWFSAVFRCCWYQNQMCQFYE